MENEEIKVKDPGEDYLHKKLVAHEIIKKNITISWLGVSAVIGTLVILGASYYSRPVSEVAFVFYAIAMAIYLWKSEQHNQRLKKQYLSD